MGARRGLRTDVQLDDGELGAQFCSDNPDVFRCTSMTAKAYTALRTAARSPMVAVALVAWSVKVLCLR